jgi:hypothetical protein
MMNKLFLVAVLMVSLFAPADAFARLVRGPLLRGPVVRGPVMRGPVRGPVVRGGYHVGARYGRGVWYGVGARRFYGGRWWPYGVGACWLMTPIGYVWTCGG